MFVILMSECVSPQACMMIEACINVCECVLVGMIAAWVLSNTLNCYALIFEVSIQ